MMAALKAEQRRAPVMQSERDSAQSCGESWEAKEFFLKSQQERVIAQQFHIVIVQIHKARMQFMSRSDVSDPDLLFKCDYGVNCALNLHGWKFGTHTHKKHFTSKLLESGTKIL